MLLRVTMVLGGVVASPSKHLNTWDRLTSLHHVAYSHPAICLDFPPTLASPPPQCHSAYTGSGKNIQNSDANTDPSCSARCENLTINQWDDISVSLLSLSLSLLRKTFLLLHEQSSSFRYHLLVVETGTCSIIHSFETAVDRVQQSYEVFSSGKKSGDRLFLCYVAPTSTLAKEAHSPYSHSFQLKSPGAPSLEFDFCS
jgi:endogenous inhibitor of DNA gyrase (YacG/DUF329 family)